MSTSAPRRRNAASAPQTFAALPPEIRGAAFDAAVVEAHEYALRFRKARPTLQIDSQSPRVADRFVRAKGVVTSGSGALPMRLDKDAFTAQMRKLEDYMRRERIATIDVPMETDPPPPHSLIVGAAEALFSRGC